MMSAEACRGAALLIIDLQKAIDDARWAAEGPRNNHEAEANIARLLDAWRRSGSVLAHVRHDSTEPGSTYRPGGPGHDFKPEAQPLPGETVIPKRVHSAFVDGALGEFLARAATRRLVVCGVITNNSVETTVRHGANLGYEITLAEDACFTFAKRDAQGMLRSAEDVHAMSLANLAGEYCRIATTAELLDDR
jgi:nicotinamidase-related amidase